MFGLDPIIIALIFIGLGIALAILAQLILRSSRTPMQSNSVPTDFQEAVYPADAGGVIVVGPGGNIVSANDTIREWLNLSSKANPNLEHIARRISPPDAFLELCATPQTRRLSLQGLFVDAASYAIPGPDGHTIVVTLNRVDITPLNQESSAHEKSALDIISELGVLMTTSSDLPTTIRAILESVERLIPADIAEISIWQPEENQLVPFRLVGPSGNDRNLNTPATRYKVGEGYTGNLFKTLEPIIVNISNRPGNPPPVSDHKTYPFKSYLGVPLVMDETPIGTLELGSLSNDYTQKDLETLKLLSNQASVALHHALSRKEEEQRVIELTGLANIVQAVGSIRSPENLFAHLVQSIQPLIDVEVLGFVTFDENAQQLQGQAPFLGIPDHFTALYRTQIEPGSPAETLWLSQEIIIATDAENDPQLKILGIAPFVQASGIRNTVLVPLSSSGASLGYLQAANKKNGKPFTAEEMRILKIIGSQSAVIIENASLLNKSRQRTIQAEALHRISAIAGSAVTLDEILLFTLNEIVRINKADKGVIYLLDEEQTTLSMHMDSAYGVSDSQTAPISTFKVDDPLFARSNTARGEVRVMNLHTPELENDPFYKPIFIATEIESGLSVPLTVSDHNLGEIILGSNTADFFHHAEVTLASTAAGQLAGAIERVMLTSRTDDNLRNRLEELTTLNRITRELNASKSLDELLPVIHREALHVTGADCGTIYHLYVEGDDHHIVGSAGEVEGSQHKLSALERTGITQFDPTIIRDFETTFGSAPHGGVDAVLMLPLVVNETIIGLISLHSFDPTAFDTATVEAANSFAAQAALTLWNFSRFNTTSRPSHSESDPAYDISASPHTGQRFPLSEQTQKALNFIQTINQQTSSKEIYAALTREMVAKFSFDLSMIATSTTNGAVLAEIAGDVPMQINPDVLFGQRNPLRQTLKTGKVHYQPDLTTGNGADDWQSSPLLSAFDARGFISIPIPAYGNESISEAAVMGISKKPMTNFSTEDRDTLIRMSRQVSASLQNIQLVSQTEERLREVDLLLNFSRRLTSMNTDEILHSMLESTLSVVSEVQGTQILLWDSQREHLVPFSISGYHDNDAMARLNWQKNEGLPGKVFAEGAPQRIDEINIALDYNLPYEKLLLYQEATAGFVPIASLAVPLVSSTSTLGVFILDNFSKPAAFQEIDETLINSLATQTALILENARLLEEANARAIQLEALTDAAAKLTSDLQVETITSSLLDSLSRILPFDTATFWLREGEKLTIRAALGFEGDEDRVGLRVQIQDSQLLSDMIAESRPINVRNVTKDARFVLPSEFDQLSWLGIPLIAKSVVVGVIALEKAEESFYTQDHILIATAFASQAAVALENARLFEESIQRAYELNERSQRLDLLNKLSMEFSTSMDTTYIVKVTAQEIHKATSANAVSAILLDQEHQGILVAQSPEITSLIPQPFDISPFTQLQETLGVMIVDNVYADTNLQALENYWKEIGTQTALILSIASGEDLHGMLILHSHERLNPSEVELARTISNQVAVAVQNAKLFDQSKRLTEELEARVQLRTKELEKEHQRSETLLGIITELSASLDMDIVLDRTLGIINRITGAEHSTIILANPADTSLFRRASQGYTPPVQKGGEHTDIEINEGLAGWVIENREAALIDDLREDARWLPRGETSHRSALAIPLMLGTEALGALMLYHTEVGHFSRDLLGLINAAARQIAVAVNNAHLYLLIRDQAERLGGMLRNQQIEASRLRAILEAVADGILVTDSRGQISIFNRSAENILNLEHETIINRSLDYFTGLFGKAGRQWMETIRTWSTDPYNFDAEETFFEQIELDNKRIVAVNLAPVYAAREFLGTVSIFRDITHLIEVDRMKSEFVATVSHELRTPMTSIKGYVDVMLMGAAGELSDQQENFLNIVKTNTERLNILVNDLLEVSRIEAGKINLNLVPIDLEALAENIAADYRLLSGEEGKNLQINVAKAVELPEAEGDADRVRQILTNLIGNAYNYTPNGGKVKVSFKKLKSSIQVDVKDTGIGIPQEEQEQVFERFFRGEAPLVSSVAGTGLGLSIVKYFVTLHGGEIWVESTGHPGEGSTFMFTLPISSQENEAE